MHPYQLDPHARPCTVTLSPRQWTRVLLDPAAVLSQHLTRYVLCQLSVSDDYPDDHIPASTTPREAALVVAIIRDDQTRGA